MNPTKSPLLPLLALVFSAAAYSVRADDAATVSGPPPAPPAGQPAPDGARPSHHKESGFVLSELTTRLNLTADQQRSVGAIIDSAKAQAKAVREDDNLSRNDMRSKVREIRQTARASIRAVLTADQQAIFDTLGPRGHGAPKSPAT